MSIYWILRKHRVPLDHYGVILAISEGVNTPAALRSALQADCDRTAKRIVDQLESLGLVDVVRNSRNGIVSCSLVTDLSQDLYISNGNEAMNPADAPNLKTLGETKLKHQGLKPETSRNQGQNPRISAVVSGISDDSGGQNRLEVMPPGQDRPDNSVTGVKPVTWRSQDKQLLQQLLAEYPQHSQKLARDPWGAGYVFPWSRHSVDIVGMAPRVEVEVPGLELREIYVAITFMEFRYNLDIHRTRGAWRMIREALRETRAAVGRGGIKVPSRLFQSILYERAEGLLTAGPVAQCG